VAEDGDDDIAGRRLGDLLLESRARLVIGVFPADCLEPGNSLEFAVEALDHAFDAHTLEMRVARRRDEDANRFHAREVTTEPEP
jgi:hypothetical protein